MLSEPSHNTKEARERLVELLFEKFDAPGEFLRPLPSSVAQAGQRLRCLVHGGQGRGRLVDLPFEKFDVPGQC